MSKYIIVKINRCFYIFCYCLLLPCFAWAGTTEGRILEDTGRSLLDEVVVTGMASATRIRQSPLPIELVQGKQLEQSTQNNIVDAVVRNTVGVFAVKTGTNISKPFIRGLGYNRVLTLYDGVRQEGQQWGEEHGLELDPYNQGRVEVVKGPSSIMYGSDALAGVIAFYPSMPEVDGTWQGRVLSEYHSNTGLLGTGAFVGYKRNNFVFAVRGSYKMAKNYRNRKTEEIYGSSKGRVYNTAFQERNLSLLLGYESPKNTLRFNFTLYDDLQEIPDGTRDSSTLKFTYQDKEGEDDNPDQRPIVAEKQLNSYKISVLHQRIQHYRAYVNASHKFGDANLDWTLALQQNRRREFSHPIFAKQPGLFMRLNTLFYSLRYTFPTIHNLQFSVGFNGMTQANKNLQATDFPIPDYLLFGGGLYVHGKWKYKKWTLIGAVRYDLRQVTWQDFYTKIDNRGFDMQANRTDAESELLFPKYNHLYRGLSASFGVTHAITDFLSWKFNIGRGYRAPNITEMGSNGLDPGAHIIFKGNRQLSPEFSLQEDLGISVHTQDFVLDLSAFNNNISGFIYLNLQVNEQGKAILDPQGNKTYKYLQTSAQLYGIEGRIKVNPRLLPALLFTTGASITYGFNRGKQFNGKGIEGGYLPLIPPFHLLSNLSYDFAIKSKWLTAIRPNVDLEYNGAQNRYLAVNNTETPTPGYLLLGAGLEFEFKYYKDKNISLILQGSNLLNTLYQSHLSRLKYFYSQGLGIYGIGRDLSIKLVFKF